jgi:hypothetical protein
MRLSSCLDIGPECSLLTVTRTDSVMNGKEWRRVPKNNESAVTLFALVSLPQGLFRTAQSSMSFYIFVMKE